MTITETQQTAQLAADAAVSAAEAKQYMLEAEQGYQDTSAAAQQAQDAAGSALLSKQSAATSEENSLQYATEAGVARDEAVTAASNASEYAQNKFTFYKTASDPDGTIAGLAATTDGQSFWVAQGPDALSAAWQYQNKAGVAVLQAKQPGTAAITETIREFPTLAAAQEDADAGNIPVGSTAYYRIPGDNALAVEVINNAGTLQPTGRKMPSQAAVDSSLEAVTEINKLITSDFVAAGYSAAITDPDGNAALLINDRGGVEVPELIVGGTTSIDAETFQYVEAITDPAGNVAFGIRDTGVVDAPELMSGGIITSESEMPGWMVAWTDDDGNIAFGLRDDGTIYPDASGSVDGVVEFSANESDIIAILGDSYTDSLYTLSDKSYIGNLSALSDYRFRNYGVSGNTATAINKRLVDSSAYFDGKTFSQMNAKYALIMTYQNDSAYFINHAMEYYMYNMERLIDSVMAYGAVPIVVAEWVISNEAAVQLRALCARRGIAFIYNADFMKEVGNLVLSNFHQGHPGTRTNGVIWASLYEHLRRMPRPTRSIKIYRQRPTYSPSADSDMLFSDSIDMLTKWKEIRVSHRSLSDADEPYFEELRGRGNVTSWQVRADEYDLLGGVGVAYTNRLLVNITYPAGAVGMKQAGFTLQCDADTEIFIRHILDSATSIGQSGDVTPGATSTSTLTPDYLEKYDNPRGAWQKIGTGPGEYLFSENLHQIMFGDQIQVMLKSVAGTLTNISGKYQSGASAPVKYPLPEYRPQSQLLGETFVDFSSWVVSGVTSLIPLDQVNTPRNLSYTGALATVALLMNGSTMKKTVAVTMPATRDFTQPVTLQVILWGRYFPKAYLDNSIYNLDPTQVVDSSQPENTFPATSPITSDTCDFRNVALRCSLGGTMTLQNTITQRDFACLFWRPLKYIVEIPAYVSVSQLTRQTAYASDYLQLLTRIHV
ncbi:hypothetical protein M9Y53_23575 [Klebsiella pneumoniae]|uniref:SGNH/GDSL hydrolase family protein n=1 Tax=Klebsiella pneumoniae TaxID=573 RepID=UPI0020233135|nr:hypothetical protein [Klebsiella pneumoniae]MCL8337111.1 hypothetical protein [Klebsiella pneumoniae]